MTSPLTGIAGCSLPHTSPTTLVPLFSRAFVVLWWRFIRLVISGCLFLLCLNSDGTFMRKQQTCTLKYMYLYSSLTLLQSVLFLQDFLQKGNYCMFPFFSNLLLGRAWSQGVAKACIWLGILLSSFDLTLCQDGNSQNRHYNINIILFLFLWYWCFDVIMVTNCFCKG